MIEIAADAASWILIGLGSLAVLTGGIGIVRMPDVYTRMHAASLTDTMGAGLFVIALALQAPDWLIAVKLFVILLFLFFTSPTSTFALAHAALTSDVKPILAEDLEGGKPREGAS